MLLHHKLMLFALLVHYVSTQDSLFWSHCSKNSNWQRANPHYNAIKSWLKSIHFNQEKSPAYPWKITKVNQSKKGEEAEELIHTIAKFQDGKWKGWKLTSTQETMALELNGYFYGTMDESMQMNGDDVIFVYPDFSTILVGTFVNGTMKSAKPSKISAFRCRDGLLQIKGKKPKPDAPIFAYQPLSTIRISNEPTIRDPLEVKNVYSKAGPFGDSLFAKRAFKKGELVTYYSGTIVENLNWANKTGQDRWDFHKNLMSLGNGVHLNVLKEYWPLEKYRATIGHKVNHSFKKDNMKFGYVYHPRFGHIRSNVAIKDIKKDEELFVNYGYGTHSPNVPQWYIETYEMEMGEPYPQKTAQNRQSSSCGSKS